MPEVLTFNVLDMIAEQLINPELVYGWGDVWGEGLQLPL
jgi:hypothetical protein